MPFSFANLYAHHSPASLSFEEDEAEDHELNNVTTNCLDELFFDRKKYFFMIKLRSTKPTVLNRELPPGVYALRISNNCMKRTSLNVRIIGHARQNYPPFNSTAECIKPQQSLTSRFKVGHNMPNASVELKLTPTDYRKKWIGSNKIKCTIILEKTGAVLDNDYRYEPEALEVPPEFNDPITKDIMEHPVVASDGHTYEKSSIEQWIQMGQKNSPLTNEPLESDLLIPNYNLSSQIEAFQDRMLKHEEKRWDYQEQQEAFQKEQEEKEERMRRVIGSRRPTAQPSYDVLEEIVEYVDEEIENENDEQDESNESEFGQEEEEEEEEGEGKEKSEGENIVEVRHNTSKQKEEDKSFLKSHTEQNQKEVRETENATENQTENLKRDQKEDVKQKHLVEEVDNSDYYSSESQGDTDTVVVDSDGSFLDIESTDDSEGEENMNTNEKEFEGKNNQDNDKNNEQQVESVKRKSQINNKENSRKTDDETPNKKHKEHNVNSPSRDRKQRHSDRKRNNNLRSRSSPVLRRNCRSFHDLRNLNYSYQSTALSSLVRKNNGVM